MDALWFIHMWQSRVKIEHYSIAYFDRVATFKVNSVKGGAHSCYIDLSASSLRK